MRKQRIVAGTIIAATAGLLAGLLTAKKSGKETRADIKQRAEEMRKNTTETVEKVSKNITDKFTANDE